MINDKRFLSLLMELNDCYQEISVFQGGGVVIGGEAGAGVGEVGVGAVAAAQVEVEEPAEGIVNPVVGGGADALAGGLGAAHQALLQRDGPTGRYLEEANALLKKLGFTGKCIIRQRFEMLKNL